jgi:hypothetical protein
MDVERLNEVNDNLFQTTADLIAAAKKAETLKMMKRALKRIEDVIISECSEIHRLLEEDK